MYNSNQILESLLHPEKLLFVSSRCCQVTVVFWHLRVFSGVMKVLWNYVKFLVWVNKSYTNRMSQNDEIIAGKNYKDNYLEVSFEDMSHKKSKDFATEKNQWSRNNLMMTNGRWWWEWCVILDKDVVIISTMLFSKLVESFIVSLVGKHRRNSTSLITQSN